MAEALAPDSERDVAVRRLVAKLGRRGFALAFDLLGSREDAEDAVQETVARALTGFARMRDRDALEAWFLRVLTNLCLRWLRRRRVAALFRRLWDPESMIVRPPAPGLGRDSARVLAEIDRLPPMQKAVVVLRYGHDLGIDGIAAVMGIKAETVKTHLKRARARMHERLGDDHAA